MEEKHFLRWVPRYQQLRAEGHDVEDILKSLKEAGASLIDSMAVLMELEGISLRQAKLLVFTSHAWRDMRDREDAFHSELEEKAMEALRQLKKYRGTEGKRDDQAP